MTLFDKMAEEVGERRAREYSFYMCPHFHFEKVTQPEPCLVEQMEIHCHNCWCREWKEEYGKFRGSMHDIAGESQ